MPGRAGTGVGKSTEPTTCPAKVHPIFEISFAKFVRSKIGDAITYYYLNKLMI